MFVTQIKNSVTKIVCCMKLSAFFKNVFLVMSGTAVAQLIGFALTPIISRLFDPADFGIFGSFNAVLTVIVAVATLQYSQALMLPKKDEDAINIFFVSCISVGLVSILCLLVLAIAPSFFLGIMKTENVWLPILLVLAVLVAGLNQSLQAWCIRRKAFRHIASSQIIRTTSACGSQIGLGFFKSGGSGLVIGAVFANIAASLNLFKVMWADLKFLWPVVRKSRMIMMAKEYRDFPIYSATQNMMNALMQGLPVLLLSYFYGITIAGAYAFGMRVIQLPFNFILSSFRQVFFQKASEAHNQKQNLWPLFLKTTLGLAVVSLPLSILFFFGAPGLFAWVFGEQWQVAGEYAGWLALWLMVGFCIAPSVLLARILRKQKQLLIYEFVHLTLSANSLIIGGLYFKAHTTVILFSVVGMLANSTLIVWASCAIKHVNNDIEINLLEKIDNGYFPP